MSMYYITTPQRNQDKITFPELVILIRRNIRSASNILRARRIIGRYLHPHLTKPFCSAFLGFVGSVGVVNRSLQTPRNIFRVLAATYV